MVKWRLLPLAWLIAAASARADDAFPTNLQLSINTSESDDVGDSDERKSYWLAYRIEQSPKKYLEWVWKDPVNLITRPIFWGGDEWTTFGIEAGVTGVIMPADKEIRDVWQRNRDSGFSHEIGR